MMAQDTYCEGISVTPVTPEPQVDVYNIDLVDVNGNVVEPIQCGGTPVYIRVYFSWSNTTKIKLTLTCGPSTGDEYEIGTLYIDLPDSSGDGYVDIAGDEQGNPMDPSVLITWCCGSCDCNEFTMCAKAETV